MSSKASIFHHPIHPMTVVFPLGLWFTSFVFDVIYTFCSKFEMAREVAYYLLLAGIVGAACAAVPGVVDYIFIRDDPKVRGTATLHLILNLIALSVFSLDAYLRSRVPEHRTNGALWLSAIGAVMASLSAWLGHSLVYRYGVGVEPAKEPAKKSPVPRSKKAE